MPPSEDITTLAPQDGPSLSVVGDTYRLLITADQTGGAYAAIDMLIPPNGGPGPHAHAAFQEAFYVLEGEIVVATKGHTYTAPKGAYVNIPLGGVPHDFKNKSQTTAHLLCILTPAGMEGLFQEIGTPVPAGVFLPAPSMTPEDAQRLAEIGKKYGQEVFPPDYLD